MADSERIKRIEETLGTLIYWVAQSSVSPISVNEAEKLLNMLAPPQTQTNKE